MERVGSRGWKSHTERNEEVAARRMSDSTEGSRLVKMGATSSKDWKGQSAKLVGDLD